MTSRIRRELVCLFASFLMMLMVAGWPLAGLMRGRKANADVDLLESVVVRRSDLETTLLAGGDLQPANEIFISCQVEDVTDSDGTMVLSVIEDGAVVRKGDELCRLDSSAIEELARQEEILVNQARASCLKARLELETARISL
jgi:HlyD family secretion protein